MKISYFLPIFDDDEAIRFLQKFTASQFFDDYKDREFIIALDKMSKRIDEIKEMLQPLCDITILYAQEDFSFNDAFHKAVELITGDMCLFLDSKLMNIEPLLKKCMSKYEKDAKIVFVNKTSNNKVKAFFKKIGQYIYKFFTNIFVSKTDKCNVITLGLIDKSIVKLLLAIPDKRCLLKNTENFYGIKTATIYIDEKVKTTDTTKGKMTSGMWTFIWSTTVLCYLVITGVLLGIIFSLPAFVKVLLAFGIIFSLVISAFSYPKHIFVLRNYPTEKVQFLIEKIDKK